MPIEQEIVDAMKGADPPQTVKDLAARLTSYKPAYVYSKLSAVLNAGLLSRDQLPWRRDKGERTRKGRPRKLKDKRLERKLEGWVDEGGSDRVQAAKALMELRQTGADVTGPPVPNDKESTIRELSRQMVAVGRDWTFEALFLLWPELRAILLPEALNGPADQTAQSSGLEPSSLQTLGAADNQASASTP
jgi:hypothetical protein